MKKKILIFCDGGFGNRYNSLISGLAVARKMDLRPEIYWPQNNWCRASFESIFASNFSTFNLSLTELGGKIDDLLPFLHDESASEILKCKFNSAYSYKDFEEINSAINLYEGIFFYPALVPGYIENEQLSLSIKSIIFNNEIAKKVIEFIKNELSTSFYGVHLRRTDLNVGFIDTEVDQLVESHPKSLFFVCSDDPAAEKIASRHKNVRIRKKQHYVEKKTHGAGWNAITLDDDARPYNSNIDRGAESVLESVIDLLLLAHSTIIGYSGSTFQSVARLIGTHNPLVDIAKPDLIEFLSVRDLQRKLSLKILSLPELIEASSNLAKSDRTEDAISILKNSLNNFHDREAFPILFNLSHYLMRNAENYGEANIFLQKAIEINPEFADTYILRVKACRHLELNETALKCVLDGLLATKTTGTSEKREILISSFNELATSVAYKR